MRKLLLFLFPFFLLASEIETVSIPHPENGEKNIEFFLVRPQGDGPFPIIYLLHGYQYPENATGGKQLLDYGYHKFFIGNGTIVCSISTPGFGHSDGELDFCGPYSQKAVLGVIEYCKALDAVDSSRMGLYGISRGAILGSMVSTLTEDLSLQILEAGRYNAFDTFTALPSYLKGIRENLVAEGGSDEAALLARSAIFHTDKIKAKTLILHGEFDDRMGLDSARTLHHNLIERGICSELVVLPNALHCLPWEKWEIIAPFVRREFQDLYGVGMNIGPSVPLPQVSKILPGSSAEGKLKVGDAILEISPNNDQEVVRVSRMPTPEVVRLILGGKGSKLRLHVIHFDQSTEEIVLTREN